MSGFGGLTNFEDVGIRGFEDYLLVFGEQRWGVQKKVLKPRP